MRSGFIHNFAIAVYLAVILAGCNNTSQRVASLGEAFVGPAALKIRADIPTESATVATVKHGDRLEILQRRRRFLRVRTPAGAEGWTDERQLLSASDMANLRHLSQRAAKMPSQGIGMSFGELRVRTQPSMQAPSFLLVEPNEKFDVLAETVLPRTDLARAPLIPPTPKKTIPKKPPKEGKIPPIPLPKPPSPPPDWLSLSKTDLPAEDTEKDDAPAKPVPTDHWSLIRISGGQTGWALTRMVRMAIPDEVAQYAEGHRIVSYFPLGDIDDGGEKKKIWLWTTMREAGSYDFDSFRVFVWSLRHHRYETAYIERNVEGYSPVLLHDVDLPAGPKSRGAAPANAKFPGFSVCVLGKDGQRHQRDYALLGTTVRFAGDRACQPATTALDLSNVTAQPSGTAAGPSNLPVQPAAKESLWQRLKGRARRLMGRK